MKFTYYSLFVISSMFSLRESDTAPVIDIEHWYFEDEWYRNGNLKSVPTTLSNKEEPFENAHGVKFSNESESNWVKIVERNRRSSSFVPRAAFPRWRKSVLSYYIYNTPPNISPAEVAQLLRSAFYAWSNVTNIDFYQVYDISADINIGFGSTKHYDRNGLCRTQFGETDLGHAFYPEGGEIHFNTKYYFNKHYGTDHFFHTALHEIGHAIGMRDSSSRESVMSNSVGYVLSRLSQVDIDNVRKLYGYRPPRRSAWYDGK